MSLDFYKAVIEELAQVKSEVEKNPVYIRYRKLVELRDLYAPAIRVTTSPGDTVTAREGGSGVPAPRIRIRINPDRQKIIDMAKKLISNSVDPVPTVEILDYLAINSIKIAGEEPRNNLSAILSNSGIFDANGRRGWTLRHDNGVEQELEVENETDPDEV